MPGALLVLLPLSARPAGVCLVGSDAEPAEIVGAIAVRWVLVEPASAEA